MPSNSNQQDINYPAQNISKDYQEDFDKSNYGQKDTVGMVDYTDFSNNLRLILFHKNKLVT